MKKVEIVAPEEMYQCAEDHGWRSKSSTTEEDIPELLCLMHSEISEALEAHRNGTKDGEPDCVTEELADCVIRIFHFAHLFDLDIISAVEKKHLKNLNRPYKHGNKRC